MWLPNLIASKNKIRTDTINWAGLNRMPVIEPGQLSSMTNLSSEYAPCLSPRPSREVINTLANGIALSTSNNKLCWVDGTNFVYDGVVKGTVTATKKSMCDFNGKIIIAPDKKYYDYVAGTFGDIANMPDIDFVTVFNNRIIGIKGSDFYMTALGQYNIWTDYSGDNTDSWATDVAEEGIFTGLLGLQTPNHIICTKGNYLYELYGNKPSNFNLTKVDDTGCIDSRSMVAIDNIAYFLSSEGVMQYAGGTCKNISIELQEKYVNGSAGTDGRRYYISLFNGTVYNLYVYDTYTGLWHREDNLNVVEFARLDNNLYALSGNSIYKFNSGTETVNFEAITDRFTEQYSGAKVTSEFSFMVETMGYSTVKVYYSIDGSEFIWADTILSNGYNSYVSTIKPKRGNYIQLKIAGFGNVKIYALSRKMTIGSTKPTRMRALTWDEIEAMTWEELEAFNWNEINHRRG